MNKLLSVFITLSLALIITSCKQDDEVSSPTDGQNETTNDESLTLSESLNIDGNKRDYILYIPKNNNSSTEKPLVLNFHGFGGEANQFMDYADMRQQADENQFVVIYPQGSYSDGFSSWNPCPIGGDNKSEANDFDFVEQMINVTSDKYNIDLSRIYAIGYSNGGMMAYGLANHRSNLIAAIASISGTMLDCPGQIDYPMPVLNIHGTADYVLPYNGSASYSSAQNDIDFWINFNKAVSSPTVNYDNTGGLAIEHYTYSSANAPVEHYKYINGGHDWFNETFQNKTTSQLIWEFISRFKSQN